MDDHEFQNFPELQFLYAVMTSKIIKFRKAPRWKVPSWKIEKLWGGEIGLAGLRFLFKKKYSQAMQRWREKSAEREIYEKGERKKELWLPIIFAARFTRWDCAWCEYPCCLCPWSLNDKVYTLGLCWQINKDVSTHKSWNGESPGTTPKVTSSPKHFYTHQSDH